MPIIVSGTGSYDWRYYYSIPGYQQTINSLPPQQNSVSSWTPYFSFQNETDLLEYVSRPTNYSWPIGESHGITVLGNYSNANGLQYIGDFPNDSVVGNLPPTITASSGLVLRETGTVYDTGTVQRFYVTFDISTVYIGFTRVYRWFLWVYYVPQSTYVDPPIPAPIDVDLQLGRTTIGLWTPKTGQEAILEKYRNGVTQIRAQYNNDTQIAIIRENNVGGIMIYEEVAGVPYGNVYVYRPDRSLLDVVTAAEIGQYLD